MGDDRKHSSWVARNREPILTVLQRVLPLNGSVLELASGSGEHAAFFAPRFPLLTWLPTDIEPASLVSIRAWRDPWRSTCTASIGRSRKSTWWSR